MDTRLLQFSTASIRQHTQPYFHDSRRNNLITGISEVGYAISMQDCVVESASYHQTFHHSEWTPDLDHGI